MFSLIRHRLGDYRRNQRGTVMILFALMITILVSLVGGAVDFGQWLKARNATLNAMDAAVLATGRVMQLPGKTEADARHSAARYRDHRSEHRLGDKDQFSRRYRHHQPAHQRKQQGTAGSEQ